MEWIANVVIKTHRLNLCLVSYTVHRPTLSEMSDCACTGRA